MSSDATPKTTSAVDPALLEQCGCKRERLSNACHYSFQDLYRAKCAALGQAGDDAAEACAALYKRDRDAINETVREWAEAAGWETEMHRGSDGQEYRAFAPEPAQGSTGQPGVARGFTGGRHGLRPLAAKRQHDGASTPAPLEAEVAAPVQAPSQN